ncbi:MAG: ABC transporter permease [Bacteroidota bacterium]
MNKTPPKYSLRFFRWFCDPDYMEDIEGDLLERFEQRTNENKSARWLLTMDVLKLFRPGIIRNFEGTRKLNYYGMLKHYFKISFRNLFRAKLNSAINIIGISTAVTVCILTLLFYEYETSFDSHHTNSEKIFRVVQHTKRPDQTLYWSNTAYPLANALRNDFPEFEKVSQVSGPTKRLFSLDNRGGLEKFEEEHVLFVDKHYPSVFDVEWINGDGKTAFDEPNAVVITESIARKCFPDAGPRYQKAIGHILNLNSKDPLQITGIVKDPPPNINLQYKMLVSYEFFKKHNPYPTGNWSGNYQGTTLIMLDEDSNTTSLEQQINGWKGKYLNDEDNQQISYFLQPLVEVHTDDTYTSSPGSYSLSKRILNTSLLVAAFVLLIAIANFINLVTAQATGRSKEVGIRKTIGGSQTSILGQFLCENGILVLISILLSLLFSFSLLELLNESLSIINMSLSMSNLNWTVLIAISLLIVLLSSTYPAFVISSFKPVNALKNQLTGNAQKGFLLRKVITLIQFTIVQLFVISAIIIGLQLNFFENKALGFDSDQVITVPIPDSKSFEVFKNKLEAESSIKAISIGSGPPMAVEDFALGTTFRLPHEGRVEGKQAEMKIADSLYFDFFDLNLIAGGNFTKNGVSFDQFIVNKQLVEAMNWTPQEAIGKQLEINEGEATIIGVVDDFHNHSLQHEITPVVFLNWGYFRQEAFIKISDVMSLVTIQETWETLFPTKIFNFNFLEDSMVKEYRVENLVSKAFGAFSMLVIVMSCLGLLGLIAHISSKRTKEIGIRKVLGATFMQVVNLFAKELYLLIMVSFLIAIPAVYYVGSQWLDMFSYRIKLSPIIFIVGGALTFTIGYLVMLSQSIKAYSVDPVESLKDE